MNDRWQWGRKGDFYYDDNSKELCMEGNTVIYKPKGDSHTVTYISVGYIDPKTLAIIVRFSVFNCDALIKEFAIFNPVIAAELMADLFISNTAVVTSVAVYTTPFNNEEIRFEISSYQQAQHFLQILRTINHQYQRDNMMEIGAIVFADLEKVFTYMFKLSCMRLRWQHIMPMDEGLILDHLAIEFVDPKKLTSTALTLLFTKHAPNKVPLDELEDILLGGVPPDEPNSFQSPLDLAADDPDALAMLCAYHANIFYMGVRVRSPLATAYAKNNGVFSDVIMSFYKWHEVTPPFIAPEAKKEQPAHVIKKSETQKMDNRIVTTFHTDAESKIVIRLRSIDSIAKNQKEMDDLFELFCAGFTFVKPIPEGERIQKMREIFDDAFQAGKNNYVQQISFHDHGRQTSIGFALSQLITLEDLNHIIVHSIFAYIAKPFRSLGLIYVLLFRLPFMLQLLQQYSDRPYSIGLFSQPIIHQSDRFFNQLLRATQYQSKLAIKLIKAVLPHLYKEYPNVDEVRRGAAWCIREPYALKPVDSDLEVPQEVPQYEKGWERFFKDRVQAGSLLNVPNVLTFATENFFNRLAKAGSEKLALDFKQHIAQLVELIAGHPQQESMQRLRLPRSGIFYGYPDTLAPPPPQPQKSAKHPEAEAANLAPQTPVPRRSRL